MKELTYEDFEKGEESLDGKNIVILTNSFELVKGKVKYVKDHSAVLLSDDVSLNGRYECNKADGYKYGWRVYYCDFPIIVYLLETGEKDVLISLKPKKKISPYKALLAFSKTQNWCQTGVDAAIEDVQSKYPQIDKKDITWEQAAKAIYRTGKVSYFSELVKHYLKIEATAILGKLVTEKKAAKKKVVAKKKAVKKAKPGKKK